MVLKSAFGNTGMANARLALSCLWFFSLMIGLRLLSLPVALPHMGLKGVLVCGVLAVALWVWIESECRSIYKGRGFSHYVRFVGIDTTRPWLSWGALVGAIGAGVLVATVIYDLAAVLVAT